MRYIHWVSIGASVILGLLFVAAGLGKLLSPAESFKAIFNPFPAFLSPFFTEFIFSWLPYIEIVIGLLLILGILAKVTAAFSSVLIAGFIINNSWLLRQGLGYEPCDCFGIWERITQVEFSTLQALYLDVVMLVLVMLILFCYRKNFLIIYPWFVKRDKIA